MGIKSTLTLHSGSKMPVLGLGTWKLTNNTAEVVAKALRMGYRMIDTSGDYGTQPGVGEGIRHSGIDRNKIYLVTKVEETDEAYAAAHDNLEELGMDYVDLLLIHRPPKDGAGEELWKGLIRARSEGLTRDIGVSNYSIEQIQDLFNATGEVPTVNQIEWTPFGHSMEMLDYCQENEIVIQAYSPLTHDSKLNTQILDDIAAKYGKTPAQVLIRWNLQLGTVPLPKANSLDHLKENLAVFDFEINLKDMAALNRLNKEYSALGHLAYV